MIPGAYTKTDIEYLLDGLSRSLAGSGKRISSFVFGGAGLALTHGLRDTARDVDMYVLQHAQLARVAGAAVDVRRAFNDNNPDIASKPWLDLNRVRLREYAVRKDRYFTRLRDTGTSLQHFYLATPETQLVFKLMRCVPVEKDFNDMVTLCTYLGIDNIKQLRKLWHELACDTREAQRHGGYDFVERRWTYIEQHRRALLSETSPLAARFTNT